MTDLDLFDQIEAHLDWERADAAWRAAVEECIGLAATTSDRVLVHNCVEQVMALSVRRVAAGRLHRAMGLNAVAAPLEPKP